MMGATGLLLILLLGQSEVRVWSQVSPERIYYGQSAEMVISVTGIEAPPEPVVHASDQLDFRFIGQEDRSTHTIELRGGAFQERKTLRHAFRYVITPKESGQVTLPGATLTHQGKAYRTNQPTLTVIAPEKQDRVILEIDVGRGTYSIEEPFDVTLRIWVQKLPEPWDERDPFIDRQWPRLEIPWMADLEGFQSDSPEEILRPLLSQAQHEGFQINDYTAGRNSPFDLGGLFGRRPLVRFRLKRAEDRRSGSDGEERDYFRYTLKKRFLPLRPGAFTFGPANLKGSATIDVDRKRRRYITHDFYVVGEPVSVTVRPLPEEGKPDTFTGGIGRFSFEASASPTRALVGDPITLTFEIRGEGLLERIGPPVLGIQEALTRDFKVYEDSLAGVIEKDKKTFTTNIRPRRTGVSEIPPIEFSYYSVDRQAYETVRTEPIPIQVTEAETLAGSDIVQAPAGRRRREMRETGKGIFANYTGLDAILDRPAHPGTALVAAAAASPLFYLLLLLGVTRHRRAQVDPARLRSRKAPGRATRALRGTAGIKDDRAGALRCIARALLDYVADKEGVPSAGLTPGDVAIALERRAVPEEVRGRLRSLLDACDQARFGGGREAEVRLLSEDGERLVRELERIYR